MTRRRTLATERDLALADRDRARRERDSLARQTASLRARTIRLEQEAAAWEGVALLRLRRVQELQARPPVQVTVQGQDVVDRLVQNLDFALWGAEVEPA